MPAASVIAGSFVLKSPALYDWPEMLNSFLTGTSASSCTRSSTALLGGAATRSIDVAAMSCCASHLIARLHVEQFGY